MHSTKRNSFRTDKQLESGSLRMYVTDKQTKQNKHTNYISAINISV